MERLYKCWQCKFYVVGHDPLPCSVDHVCPRCGAGARTWIPTQEEKLRGASYYDVSSDLILRLGREHQQLWANGFLKLKTHDTDILEVCDISDFTPSV